MVKQLYMDNTLCEVQYHKINHFNNVEQTCHESSFAGFRHSLGARVLVVEDECNAIIDNIVEFNVMS